jgi:hypothetical protein
MAPSPGTGVSRMRQRASGGERGKLRATPRAGGAQGVFMTGKRVNARQNAGKICSEPTKARNEYGPRTLGNATQRPRSVLSVPAPDT